MIVEKIVRPTRLFKYCAFNEDANKMLRDGKAWYALPETFNDPFDCNIQLSTDITDEEYLKWVSRYASSAGGEAIEQSSDEVRLTMKATTLEHLQERYEEVKKMFGIFCMAKRRDNMLMWSHYADEHKGFCIEIEVFFPQSASNHLFVRPVRYGPHPDLSIWDMFDSVSNDEAASQKRYETFSAIVMSCKDQPWSYECEWRDFLTVKGNEKGVIGNLPGRISSVAFGLAMKYEDKRSIMNVLGANVFYFQTKRKTGTFEIKFDTVPFGTH